MDPPPWSRSSPPAGHMFRKGSTGSRRWQTRWIPRWTRRMCFPEDVRDLFEGLPVEAKFMTLSFKLTKFLASLGSFAHVCTSSFDPPHLPTLALYLGGSTTADRMTPRPFRWISSMGLVFHGVGVQPGPTNGTHHGVKKKRPRGLASFRHQGGA